MTKIIFFDTGPIISLVMSRLVWILPKVKEQYGGKFYITPAVRKELIERPLTTRRFKFEALQALKLIRDGVLEEYTKIPAGKVRQLTKLANSSFSMKNKTIDVIQAGEMESMACALAVGADAVVMDERTLRLFIENPNEMKSLLSHRFKKSVQVHPANMKLFSKSLQGMNIIRSIELISIAFKMGLLDSYIPRKTRGRSELLDAVLWAAKYNGCAVTEHEIIEIEEHLLRG
jgi:hypothetical protein